MTALLLIMVILLPSPRAWIFCKLILPRALILILPSVVVTTVLIPLLSFSSKIRSILPRLVLMILTLVPLRLALMPDLPLRLMVLALIKPCSRLPLFTK